MVRSGMGRVCVKVCGSECAWVKEWLEVEMGWREEREGEKERERIDR